MTLSQGLVVVEILIGQKSDHGSTGSDVAAL